MARRMTMAFLFALAAGFIGAVLCSSFTPTAFGEEGQTVQAPPPMHKMGFSGIAGDEEYLYVMAGGKIMAYQLSDMSLVKTVALPDPPAEALPPKPETTTKNPPPFGHPHGGGLHGLWANDRYLFVLAGPVVYEYSTPDLTLVSTKVLPKPEPPTVTN